MQLYKLLAVPQLKYNVQVWSPSYGKDVIELERVPKQCTRILPCLAGFSYKERLDRLWRFLVGVWGMTWFEVHRIEMDKVTAQSFFSG